MDIAAVERNLARGFFLARIAAVSADQVQHLRDHEDYAKGSNPLLATIPWDGPAGPECSHCATLERQRTHWITRIKETDHE